MSKVISEQWFLTGSCKEGGWNTCWESPHKHSESTRGSCLAQGHRIQEEDHKKCLWLYEKASPRNDEPYCQGDQSSYQRGQETHEWRMRDICSFQISLCWRRLKAQGNTAASSVFILKTVICGCHKWKCHARDCLCVWDWSAAQLLVPSWVLLWCIKDCAPGDCLHQPSEMDQHSWCSDFHHINCWKWQGSSLVINSVSDTACNFHDNKHVKNVDTLLVIYLKLLRIGYWRCYQSLMTVLYGQFANLQEKYSRWSINH